MKKASRMNKIKLIFFCAILGAASGAVLWIFLKIIQLGTELLWDRLPGAMNSPIWYPIVICTIGGAIIGIFRKHFGDYPQTMKTVIATVKQTGTYPYRSFVPVFSSSNGIMDLSYGSTFQSSDER